MRTIFRACAAGIMVVSVHAAGRAYAGGISVSDKQAVAANGDRVRSRFTRGMGRNPAAGGEWSAQDYLTSAS